MAFDPRIRLVTVSASYGAGGAVVAPALAERRSKNKKKKNK
jgi:hypothetical protein